MFLEVSWDLSTYLDTPDSVLVCMYMRGQKGHRKKLVARPDVKSDVIILLKASQGVGAN